MRAIDTNVLVRVLVQDDAAQAGRAEALLAAHRVFVPVTVVLELEWVLRARYGYSPRSVAQAIAGVASLPNVVMAEREAVLRAAGRAEQGWDFADALHHALSAGCDDFVTLDTTLVKRARSRQEARGVSTGPRVTKL